MNGEVKEAPKRRLRDLVWIWLCWLGVAVMLYVLSLGPVVMMVQKGFISPAIPENKFVRTFYYPIEWAGKKIPMLKHLMGKYLHLWAPKLYDRKGYSTGLY
jgi:hypothetical protein